MSGMALDGVRPPEDHQVRSILDFAQGTGAFSYLLNRHHGGGVAQRGRRVDGAADALRQSDGRPLSFAGAARHAVDQRRVCRSQNLCVGDFSLLGVYMGCLI